MSYYDNLNAICHGNTYFTEQDEVLVHNLYIYNIPDYLTNENDLKDYFEHFGEVKAIEIYRDGLSDGLVCFKNPQGAARALNRELHIFNSTKLKVQAADSWLQPSAPYKELQSSFPESCYGETSSKAVTEEKLLKTFFYTHNNDESKEQLSVLDLNDDCLLHIFSFLTVKDKFKLAILCKRFQDIFEREIRIKRKLTIGLLPGNCKTLTLGELREILLLYGNFIHHVTLISAGTYYSSYDDNINQRCEFLIRSCPNLQIVELKDINLKQEVFNKIVNNLHNITTLRLHYCGITDEICKLFLELKELQILDLTENFEITGRYISGFQNLHELNLLRCRNVKGKYFIEICKKLHLKALNIVRCGYLDVKCFREMVSHLRTLEELMISNNYCEENLKPLAELRNLKLLEISGVPTNGDDFFGLLKGLSNRQREISEKKSKRKNSNSSTATLEELKIIDLSLNDVNKTEICSLRTLRKLSFPWVEQVSDQFMEDVAKNLPLLTYLNASFCIAISKKGILELLRRTNKTIQTIDISGCRQINSSLILNAIAIFLELGRTESCTFCVGGTGIGKDFLKDEQYIRHKDLVKLSFKIWQSDYW